MSELHSETHQWKSSEKTNTSYLSHQEISMRKPIRSSKNLRIDPKFRSSGILGKFVLRSGQRLCYKKIYHEMIRRLWTLDPERHFIDPEKIYWSSGWLRKDGPIGAMGVFTTRNHRCQLICQEWRTTRREVLYPKVLPIQMLNYHGGGRGLSDCISSHISSVQKSSNSPPK